MVHSHGKRARTRDVFSKPFRRHGAPHFQRYTMSYRIGDYIDIITDGSIHKGMPHKCYHGKTGRVFNVNKHAIGVVINKQHNGRIIPKRIHVRIEHIRKSRSRLAFVERVKKNDEAKRAAKARNEKISCKRLPAAPIGSQVVAGKDIKYVNATKFRELY